MKKIAFTMIIITAFIETGCNERIDSSCSSQDAKNLISEIVSEEAEKLMLDHKNKNGDVVFSKEKIRDSLKKIPISIEDIRTTNRDQNSTKASCAGNLVLNVDAGLLDTATKAREKTELETLYDFAVKLGIKIENNKFLKSIEYYVQPTDDGKKIYAGLEKNSNMDVMLNEIATSYLLFNFIESNSSNESHVIDERNSAMNSEIESGKKLLELWSKIPEKTKLIMAGDQKSWVESGEKACKAKAINSNLETDAEKDILYFNCLEKENLERIDFLNKKVFGDVLNIIGTWSSGDGDSFYNLTFEKNGFEINAKLNVGYGDCLGEITGKLVNRSGKMAIISNEYEQECIVDTSFSGDDVEISEGENCSYYHGASCGFYGTLRKQAN